MIKLGSHFRSDEVGRHSEWLRQRKWFIKARHDHEKREELADKLEENLIAFSVEAIMATESQIREFEVKLDNYEAATVTALMENQKQLDAVNAHIEAMLSKAYVMDDGRRVFKTEDGTQVFDESGQEVSANELDFDLISNDLPHWEEFQLSKDEQDQFLAEKSDILTYQEKLDEAHDRVSDGDISKAELDELDELDAELLEAMPNAVRAHVSGIDVRPEAPDLTAAFKLPAALPESNSPMDVSALPPSSLQY